MDEDEGAVGEYRIFAEFPDGSEMLLIETDYDRAMLTAVSFADDGWRVRLESRDPAEPVVAEFYSRRFW